MTFSRKFLKSLLVLALTGLVASLILHFVTFWGTAPELKNPFIWGLHFGGMIIIVFALLAGGGVAGTFRPGEYLRAAFRYIPAFYRQATGVLVVYAGISFFACLVLLNSSPTDYLFGHGAVAENVRAAEFRSGQTYSLRLFSCAWIAGYAIAAAILASAINAPDNERSRSAKSEGLLPK